MFFSNSCKSKNGENSLVLVLTDWNLEPSAYTRIEGKIWKCKVAPKNNVFFQKGLNRHAYIYIYNIYIYMHISQLLESKKWDNCLILVLTVFSHLLESKKWGKLISFGVDTFFSQTFGVDMFFSNSCKSKNGENSLVLMLTDWNLEPSAYTRKIWKCKVAPKNNVFFQKGLNRYAYIYIIYIYMHISQLLESKKWENWLVLVLTCFFSTSWNKMKNYILVLVLTCFSQTPGVQKMGKID